MHCNREAAIYRRARGDRRSTRGRGNTAFNPCARPFENTAFILGEEVASFEREFAQFSGVKHCVGVANGTDALEMMLRAVGVGDRDEVIVPANSFVASAFAVIRAGAVPKFVDSDPETHLID